MSREGKFVKNTIVLAIGTFFPKVAVFITLPILTAALSKEEYGIYDLILTLVSFLLPAATMQIQTAAFRFLIDVRNEKKEITSIITNIYFFIGPVVVTVLAILYFVLHMYSNRIRLFICVYFLLNLFVNVNRQIVRGLNKNIYYTISAFISALGQIILILFLVLWKGKGLEGCMISLILSEALSVIYLFLGGKIYQYIDLKKISLIRIKEMISYSWPMVPNSLSMWVMRASDRFVIAGTMGAAANAVYSVAYRIPSILSYLDGTLNMAWQESASNATKDEDVGLYYSNMFEGLFNIVAGGMAFLIGITPILFVILIQGDYGSAYNQIPILYMGMFFCCLSSFWGGIYVAFKQTKSVGITATVAAVINLIVNISMIQFIGLYAASGSTLISYFLLCVFRIVDIRRWVQVTYQWKHICRVVIVLFLQCVICFQQKMILDVVNFIIGVILLILLNKKLLHTLLKKINLIVKLKQ